MAKYRKKPIVIEAVQWFKQGDHQAVIPIPYKLRGYTPVLEGATGYIETLEGGHFVTAGDWIITGIQGEFYPCKPDIFKATYEPATMDNKLDKTGLITPKDLPNHLLKELTYNQIRDLGYFLFEQLKAQREATLRETK